jgi:hypothetical protein
VGQPHVHALPQSAAVDLRVVENRVRPSPVTGFYSVPKKLRAMRTRRITDRSHLRTRGDCRDAALPHEAFHKPSAKNAEIRGVRYKVLWAWNAIAAHSIEQPAVKRDAVA